MARASRDAVTKRCGLIGVRICPMGCALSTARPLTNAAEDSPNSKIRPCFAGWARVLGFCPNKNDGECDWKGRRENLNAPITRTCQHAPMSRLGAREVWGACQRRMPRQ